MSKNLEVGQKAPPFSGETQDGTTVSLSDFKGKKLALYFYPKDNTSGCTKQACNLRDNYDSLKAAGVHIVGVSADSAKSHENFASKYDLPFPLIADTEKRILEDYGAFGEKKMYGRTYMGVIRMTFLIDEKGEIKGIIQKPKTTDHAAEVLAGFGI